MFSSDFSHFLIPFLSLICSGVFVEEEVVLWRSSEERLTGTDGQIFLDFCKSQVGLDVGLVEGGIGGSAWIRTGEDLKEGEPFVVFRCILDGEF